MPLSLDKLFSKTLTATLLWDGETVSIEWAPARYTGEMDDLVDEYAEEENADKVKIAELRAAGDRTGADALQRRINRRNTQRVREYLAALIVTWDVMDGDVPYPTDIASLKKLPDVFLLECFRTLGEENQPDPPKARDSDDTSVPKASSARSQRGTRSSRARTTSASRRGK
jgi:hypothetical protein